MSQSAVLEGVPDTLPVSAEVPVAVPELTASERVLLQMVIQSQGSLTVRTHQYEIDAPKKVTSLAAIDALDPRQREIAVPYLQALARSMMDNIECL